MHTRKLRLYQDEIRPEMLDYNGHVTEGWYVLLFGHASDALYEKLGMDARWRLATVAPSIRWSPTSATFASLPSAIGLRS